MPFLANLDTVAAMASRYRGIVHGDWVADGKNHLDVELPDIRAAACFAHDMCAEEHSEVTAELRDPVTSLSAPVVLTFSRRAAAPVPGFADIPLADLR